MYFTYAHYKPEGGLFYIGKGKRRRAYAMDGRNSHWQNIVNKYGKPHVELLARWDTEIEALDHEKLLISCFRDMGYKLANKAEGGTGASGYKFTDEQKKNLSLAHMGQVSWNKGLKGVQTAWNKGLPIAENAAQALSVRVSCVKCRKEGKIGSMFSSHINRCNDVKPYKARATINGKRIQIGRFKTKQEAQEFQDNYYKEHNIVRTSWNKGIAMSDETKQKASASKKGKAPWNKGTKGIMIPWNRGVPMSNEQKVKLSIAKLGKQSPRKGKTHTPESIEKMRIAKLGKKHKPESIEKARLKKLGQKQPLTTCPHCNKIGGSYTMPRWHFDNCKNKEIH